jgi:AmmeMemoRadiSam system protein A
MLMPRSRLSDEERRTLLRVARESLMRHFAGEPMVEQVTDSPALRAERAAFVTVWRRDTGDLRGCRGETRATRPLIDSVAHMVVSAATSDPRFPPVTLDEMPDVQLEINALGEMHPIEPEEVQVGRDGLMISRGPRAGLLLPEAAVKHGLDREGFLDALCRKADLPSGAWRLPDVELLAFETERCSE